MSQYASVLQEGQMTPLFTGRASPSRSLFPTVVFILGSLVCAVADASIHQSITPAQSNQAEAAKPAQEKKDDAAQAAAKSNAHHFDRVVIIVLENGDYEVAIKDENLAALAAKGASFSNFHALFHPSYPNYLAMVAGTDFGIHRRGRLLADNQVNTRVELRYCSKRYAASGYLLCDETVADVLR